MLLQLLSTTSFLNSDREVIFCDEQTAKTKLRDAYGDYAIWKDAKLPACLSRWNALVNVDPLRRRDSVLAFHRPPAISGSSSGHADAGSSDGARHFDKRGLSAIRRCKRGGSRKIHSSNSKLGRYFRGHGKCKGSLCVYHLGTIQPSQRQLCARV